MNMTLLERACCMLSNVGLPKKFWEDVNNIACYLVNKSSSIVIECKTKKEM